MKTNEMKNIILSSDNAHRQQTMMMNAIRKGEELDRETAHLNRKQRRKLAKGKTNA